MTIQQLKTSALEANPFQYRRLFPAEQMRELRDSIAEVGILQPLVVRPISGKKHAGITHQIVAGERRWRAAQDAGLKTVPVMVRAMNDIEALSLALIENTQREDPDDWATAQGIKHLMELNAQSGAPLSERAVAKLLNKSSGYVRNHLGLFKLRPTLQAVAQKHTAIKSSLFEIEKVRDPDTERDLIQAVESGASFQTIKARVDEHLAHEQWQAEHQRAPDRETQSRTSTHDRTGGGNVSRGKQVTGHSVAECREEAGNSLQRAVRNLQFASEWMNSLSEKDRRKLEAQYGETLKLKLLEMFPQRL